MTELGDLVMIMNIIPRLVALTELLRSEIFYQKRLHGILDIHIVDGEEEQSRQRKIAIEKIMDSFTDKERDWMLTHKEDVMEIMAPDKERKETTRKRRKKE